MTAGFLAVCRAAGLPAPVAEYVGIPGRRFRFDWAWPDQRIALEVNGGVWTRGRHVRGTGYLRDLEKLNLAQLAGWRVFQVPPADLRTVGVDLVRQACALSRGVKSGGETPTRATPQGGGKTSHG